VWNLVTDHGRLDITFEPSGTTGCADIERDAVRLVILGADVDVASLADVIRSKEAAGREKDRLVLPGSAGSSRRPSADKGRVSMGEVRAE